MGMVSRIRFANDETSLTLNLNMNLRVSASMSTDDREAALEKAQHVMLSMFSHECELIRTELASDCKVTQMNVTASMNQGGPMSEVGYINAGVQGSFGLMPTSTATPQQPYRRQALFRRPGRQPH
jgi:hypothetical protein